MTLREKELALENIGGAWAASMRCSRDALEARLAAVIASEANIDQNSPQNEVLRQKQAYHTNQYERLLDKILEHAQRDQEQNAITEKKICGLQTDI